MAHRYRYPLCVSDIDIDIVIDERHQACHVNHLGGLLLHRLVAAAPARVDAAVVAFAELFERGLCSGADSAA
ncbi:MAG: hypothetical protein L0K86_18150 [Actinomycetia bacterium]|nr:hypothetical protein [Actinomycetes bacterium]